MTDRPAPGYTPARGEAKFPDLTLHKPGFTMTSTSRQFGRIRERITHNSRSTNRNDGRGEVRLIVAS